MIRATYQGSKVLSVVAYDDDCRYVWIVVKAFGAVKNLYVPMSKVLLENEE